jgi:hypothetical protein
LQTGKNAYTLDNEEEEDTWSHVLAVNGFELYGTLYSGEAPQEIQSYVSPHGLNEVTRQSEMAASASSAIEPSGTDFTNDEVSNVIGHFILTNCSLKGKNFLVYPILLLACQGNLSL